MADVVLFFASNADTMIATKALKDGGITAKMIPKPAHVSATANLALSLDAGFETNAIAVLGKANVPLGGVAR
ncbi:MAG TPA: putative Se/S carrier-like protein [Candidatus Baltobacteraceae bacterium]|nr:putative Se/S carrier-like protein [Candidatus Baltobacteraceae bacterium]